MNTDNIGLPGNPYDPREAQRFSGCAVPLDEITADAIGDIGLTDATMIGLHLDRLTHAVMALAYEQRTANLIAAQTERPCFSYPQEIDERLGKGTE